MPSSEAENTPPVSLSSPFRVFWGSCIKQLAPKQSTQTHECNMPGSGYIFISGTRITFVMLHSLTKCISKVENPSELRSHQDLLRCCYQNQTEAAGPYSSNKYSLQSKLVQNCLPFN